MLTKERKLSDSSVFSMETLKTVPSDLEVTELSKKYRDLRRELLGALNDDAWGVRSYVKAETPEEYLRQIHNLVNAANNWKRHIDLKKRHVEFITHYKTNPDKMSGTLDMFFERIEE